MNTTLPLVAGMASTLIFVCSVMPMLHKAARTRDLASYSLSNIALANIGNTIHSVYVFHLPPGPIWLLHTFYLTTSAMMLFWYLRYHPARRTRTSGTRVGSSRAQRASRPVEPCPVPR